MSCHPDRLRDHRIGHARIRHPRCVFAPTHFLLPVAIFACLESRPSCPSPDSVRRCNAGATRESAHACMLPALPPYIHPQHRRAVHRSCMRSGVLATPLCMRTCAAPCCTHSHTDHCTHSPTHSSPARQTLCLKPLLPLNHAAHPLLCAVRLRNAPPCMRHHPALHACGRSCYLHGRTLPLNIPHVHGVSVAVAAWLACSLHAVRHPLHAATHKAWLVIANCKLPSLCTTLACCCWRLRSLTSVKPTQQSGCRACAIRLQPSQALRVEPGLQPMKVCTKAHAGPGYCTARASYPLASRPHGRCGALGRAG